MNACHDQSLISLSTKEMSRSTLVYCVIILSGFNIGIDDSDNSNDSDDCDDYYDSFDSGVSAGVSLLTVPLTGYCTIRDYNKLNSARIF